MVLPLLALAGVGGLMSAGSSMLDNYLQGQRDTENQQRMMAAMQAGMVGPQTVETPRQDPGFVGPGAPMQQPGYFDPHLMAMELVRQGDPQGLAMLAQQGQQQQGFQNQRMLQQDRFQHQWDRMLWEQMNQPPAAQQPTVRIDGQDLPYQPIPINSPEWHALSQEQQDLDRVRSIMDDFREALASGQGSESVGSEARRLKSLYNEAIMAMAGTTDAGALQEFENMMFGERVPNLTTWTPEWIRQESGVLEAMGDWYNARARGFQHRAQFTEGLQPLRLFPTADLVPEGWRAVTEDDLRRERERINREGGGQEVGVPTLDDLIARAQGGGYVSPAEWRGR